MLFTTVTTSIRQPKRDGSHRLGARLELVWQSSASGPSSCGLTMASCCTPPWFDAHKLRSAMNNPHSPPSQRQGPQPLMMEAEYAPPQNCHRLVILGSAKVGKTSIVSRFLNNRFDENYTPTIEDFHCKVYRIKGETHRLDILDTSGNHPFPAMRRLSLLTGNLFILVYSIDNRESFEEIKRLHEQIIESKGQAPPDAPRAIRKQQIPMVVVANKCDKESERQVETEELVNYVENLHGTAGCIETSAKRGVNIEEVFLKLFDLAKLPTEMSPSLHRKVQPTYVGRTGSPSSGRRVTIRRRLSDACGAIAPNVRRPSIRTDLLMLQTKRQLSESDDSGRDGKCVLQ